MLQNRIFNNLSELQDFFKTNSTAANKIIEAFQGFRICKALNSINKHKQKGFEALDTIYVLLLLPFIMADTVNSMLKSSLKFISNMEKDVFYRLKNNPEINWRGLLYSIAKRSQKIVQENSIEPDELPKNIIFQVQCIIFDDTVTRKTGYKIEGIGKVFDHVFQQYTLGFKMLCCCFWDGKSLNPLDFSLHSEKGKAKKGKQFRPYGLTKKQLKSRFIKRRDKSTGGYKRKQELAKSKILVMLEMLKRAVKHGFVPDYLLMDKWFISEVVIKVTHQLKNGRIHIIAACKKDRRKYNFRGKAYTASELLEVNIENKRHCRSMKTLYIVVYANYKGVPVKLFFNKPSRRRNWELLITTNLKLSFISALKIYRIRWGIEVFIKECKQHLLLGKCQSQDFDAHIADTSLSMIRYIILNQCKRFGSYETLGEVFSNTRIFTLELTLGQRLWLLFLEMCHALCELFEMDEMLFMQKLFSIPEFEESIFRFFDIWNNSKNQELVNFNNIA